MKRQLSILTTTLLLATSGYASNDGEACDRNHYQHKSHNHQSHHSDKHKFGQHSTNTNQEITLENFLASKKERFSQMDTNGDGVLTQNEMRSHRKNRHHKPMRGGMF